MRIILEQIGKYAGRPVAIGLMAIAFISAVIVIGGVKFSREDYLEVTRNQQARELDFIGQAIHHGPLSGDQSGDLRDDIGRVVITSEFDDFMRRTLFGMDIVKLDIFGLDGSTLYSTDPASSVAYDPSSPLVRDPRRGITSSGLADNVTIVDLAGTSADLQVMPTFGLMLDQAPDNRGSGRPMAILAVHRDVGSRLASVKRTVWSVAGVFFGGLSAVLLIVNHISERSRRRLELANIELQKRNEAVRESRERMVRADEEAKRAIAGELHGTVQTKLYAIWMKLGMTTDKVTDEAIKAELETLAEDVDQIREEDIRQLSHRLHPSIVRVSAAAGLRSLRDFYESLIPVELEIGDEAAALEEGGISVIPEEPRLAVYRITELALTNAARHAKASLVTVGWNYGQQAQELVLSVVDDGVGFDSSTNSGDSESNSLGLVTMNDFADALGDACHISSKSGEGTRVEVRFPFSTDESDDNGELHGRVHAVLTYLDATGQLPLKSHDPETQGSEQAMAA
jgi:signal transduction histidine kinase